MSARANRGARVGLVCMPYYKAEAPNIALGLLGALLRERGIEVDLHHLNLWFADLDFGSYQEVNNEVFFHGEWIFSHALWDTPPPDLREVTRALEGTQARFCLDFTRDGAEAGVPPAPGEEPQSWDEYSRKILAAVERVEPFLTRCLEDIDWGAYDIVGFTSTFQQHVASLALAKRLARRFPKLYIMFGGANCDGVMGEALFQAFPFVDAVCIGEGDVVFPAFVREFLAGAPPRAFDGILDRRVARGGGLRVLGPTPRPAFTELDSLPYPDYDDYFEDFVQTSFRSTPTMVYFETSRGCWYGQKQHCTFCGVNGGTIDFRTKSPERAIAEIRHIHERYCEHAEILAATDNIMPANYPRTVLPELERLGLDTMIFYETKSNLREAQVDQYRRAGVRTVQPGIESLSTRVLRLMKKGVTGIQNIQTLKWCRQYNIRARWNVLYGFPGETPEDYADQPGLFAKLHHLHAPIGCGPIRIDRFSPYQERAADYGIQNLRAHPAYREIYRELDDALLEDLAYCFVGDYGTKRGVSAYDRQLYQAVVEWRTRADEAAMFYLEGEARVVVGDFRVPDEPQLHVLEGAERLVHDACVKIQTRARLARSLGESHHIGEAAIDAALTVLLDRGLLLEEEGRFLALAFPFDESREDADAYFPPMSCWPWIGQMLAMLDQRSARVAGG